MAANPKKLTIQDAHAWNAATRVLEIECVEGGAFEQVGGKYIIVHTGLFVGDKAVKRAYSLMPVPERPGRAQLAIKRIEGPGSNALHDFPVGESLSFSGPWGKLIPEGGLASRTFLVATDTGITSALGIVEQAAMANDVRPLAVLWLRAEGETFLDVEGVAARVARAGVRFDAVTIPAVSTEKRADAAFGHIESRARALEATHVVATGDGAIVHPLRDTLPGRVGVVEDARVECFFHNPEKKSV